MANLGQYASMRRHARGSIVARVHGGSERAALENYCEVSGYNQVKLHTIVKKWGQS